MAETAEANGKVTTGDGRGQGISGRDRKFVVSRQDFMGLCRDRAILCCDIVGLGRMIFCPDKGYLGRKRVF